MTHALHTEHGAFAVMASMVPGAFLSYRLRPGEPLEILFATPSIEALCGLSPAVLVANPRVVRDIIHPDDLGRVEASFAASARDLTPFRCDFRVLHPIRGEVWVEIASGGTREPDGSSVWHAVLLDVTERKAMERELREERDRLAGLAASAPGAFASFHRTVDGTFAFTYVSPSIESLYGVPMAKLLRDANAALSLIVPEDRPRVYATIEQSAATMTPWHCEYRIMHRERGEIWIDGHSRPIRESNGALTWHGVLLDVTERKRTEIANSIDREKARSSESTLRAVVDAVPDCLILIGRDRRIRYINHLLPGFVMENVVGREAVEFISPSTRDAINNALDAVFASGQPQTYEVETPSPDGSSRWFNTRIGPVLHDGEVVGAILASSDLTERKLAEEKLRGSEALLRSVLESVSDAIVTIDAQGRVISCNPATMRMFGHDEQGIIGANISVLLPGAHLEHDERDRELVGRRKDGTAFPIELSVTHFELGGAVRRTGVLRDITARKKLEDQFRQAHKMEAFGQLAGGVAHDFNNLLTVILSETEHVASSLQDEPLSASELGESLHEINEAGQRAAGLTRQLLAFSRKTVLEPKLVDVNQIVRDTERMLSRLIGEDILVTTTLATHLEHVHVDPSQLSQVLMNLVVNARDAMPTGGRLEIMTAPARFDREHAGLPAGDYVRLVVRDNGIGMSPAVRDRVFQPFFTTKPVGKGTGLGLAVVHGIVTQSGGTIELFSTEGIGSAFEILLPVARAVPSSRSEARPAGRPTETVLVVEDDEAIRRLAVRILSNKGFKVLTAEDGASAIALLSSIDQPVDAVVTDVVMPNMDGPALGEKVRERFPKTRLLYVSGYTDDVLVRRGLMREEVDFLAKPYTPLSLTQAIQRMLARPAPPTTNSETTATRWRAPDRSPVAHGPAEPAETTSGLAGARAPSAPGHRSF